jgi:hypothetical protein
MDEKARLLQQLDGARERLRDVVDGIDVEEELYPTWTIKHILAHITGWDDAAASSLRAHAGGEDPATPAARGIDHYNAESVATREALSFEHIVREWGLARDQLKAAIEEMPPQQMAVPLILPWGPLGTLAQLVEILASHEVEHAEEVARIVADSEARAG